MEGYSNIVTLAVIRIELEEDDSIDTGAAAINFSSDIMNEDINI